MARRKSNSSATGGVVIFVVVLATAIWILQNYWPIVVGGCVLVVGALAVRGARSSRSATAGETVDIEPDRDDAVLEIVGEKSYQPALRRISGGRTPTGPRAPDHIATLIREPKNRYDHNAIAVTIDGSLVGYLAREDAVRYKAVVEWMLARGKTISCAARLIGGWDRGRGDSGSIGVLLHLGSPGETLLELLGDSVSVRSDHPWPGQMMAFTGDSRRSIEGILLDREASTLLARRAGLHVHPRVTKAVQLLVDCDPSTESGNELKAIQYGIPVVTEEAFWSALGLTTEPAVTWARRPGWQTS